MSFKSSVKKIAQKGNAIIERAVQAAPGLSDNAKEKLLSTNMAHSYGQFVQEAADADSFNDKRAALRRHHFRTIHPAHPVTSEIRQSDEMVNSSNPQTRDEGLRRRAKVDKQTKAISIAGATYGLGTALDVNWSEQGGKAATAAAKSALSQHRSNPEPGQGAANPNTSTLVGRTPDPWAQMSGSKPKGIIASVVDLLWDVFKVT